jgi:hypothetical protein
MGAWFPRGSGFSGRIHLRVRLTAQPMSSVVLELVCTSAFRTARDVGIIFVGRMSPAPTVVTLGHTRVHAGSPYCGGPAPDINLLVDKGHSLLAVLGVPQVKPDHAGI